MLVGGAAAELEDCGGPFWPGRLARVSGVAAATWAQWALRRPARDVALRAALESLGPVFVKVGQTLAQRPDLVGADAAAALTRLQDGMAPEPPGAAEVVLREELCLAPDAPLAGERASGAPFAAFDPTPVAAASLGQVHRARLHDGLDVAVKVQRPGVREQVNLDMGLLKQGLAVLRNTWGSESDFTLIADEVGKGLLRELDYRDEARNMEEFRDAHKFLPYLKVPSVVHALTTRRVLVTEWCNGRKLDQLDDPEDALRLAALGAECSCAQLLRTSFLHADPHEGNVMLGDGGELVMLDFGLVSRVEPHHAESMASAILHFIAMDWVAVLEDFRGMGVLPERNDREWVDGKWKDIDEADFVKDFIMSMEGDGETAKTFGDLWTRLVSLGMRYHFLVPPYYILVMRSFLTLEGTASRANPDFDMYAVAYPYAVRKGLTPKTENGKAALRALLLDEQSRLRWDRFSMLANSDDGESTEAKVGDALGEGSIDAFLEVIACREGRTLRRVLRKADSVAAAAYVASAAGAWVRRYVVGMLVAAIPAGISFILSGPVRASAGAKRSTRVTQVIAALAAYHARAVLRKRPFLALYVALRLLAGTVLELGRAALSALVPRRRVVRPVAAPAPALAPA